MRSCMFVFFFAAVAGCQEDEISVDGADPQVVYEDDLDFDGAMTPVDEDGNILPPRGPQDDCEPTDPKIYPGAQAPDTACTGGYWDGPA